MGYGVHELFAVSNSGRTFFSICLLFLLLCCCGKVVACVFTVVLFSEVLLTSFLFARFVGACCFPFLDLFHLYFKSYLSLPVSSFLYDPFFFLVLFS